MHLNTLIRFLAIVGFFIHSSLIQTKCDHLPPQAISPLFTFGHSILKKNISALSQQLFYTKQKPYSQTVSLSQAYYGITNNLTGLATITLLSKAPTATDPKGDKTGLADLYFQLNYLAYAEHTSKYRYRIITVGGLYLPTFTVAARTFFSFNVPRFFFGITQDAMTYEWYFYSDFGTIITTKKNQRKFGNILWFNVGGGRIFCLPHKSYLTLIAALTDFYFTPDRFRGQLDLTTGDNRLFMTRNFFTFCSNVLSDKGYLFHKYLPNGSLGSTWHSWFHEEHIQLPIQEDETAIVIYALWKHYLIRPDEKFIKKMYKNLIEKSADFLVTYMDTATGLPKESYDLWEEKLGIHTYTCCTVYAGLKAASYFADLFGEKEKSQFYLKTAEQIKNAILNYLYDPAEKRFIKGLYYHKGKLEKDMTNDASNFYGIFEFQVLPPDDPRIISTIQAFKEELLCKTEIGGYIRYQNDHYYQVDQNISGNPWFITTLWLAEYYIQTAKEQKDFKPALEIFDWVVKHAQTTGILSEQINPYTGYQISAAPLTWSHAAYVTAVTKYLEKLDDLKICKMCNPVVAKKDT